MIRWVWKIAAVSYWVKHNLPFCSAIPHINMHLSQKKMQTHPQKKKKRLVHSRQHFTVDNSWKQSKCPWRSELLFHFSRILLNNPSDRTTSSGIVMPNKRSQTLRVNTAWCLCSSGVRGDLRGKWNGHSVACRMWRGWLCRHLSKSSGKVEILYIVCLEVSQVPPFVKIVWVRFVHLNNKLKPLNEP